MPNAWFYKLKEIGRTRSHNTSANSMKKKHPTATSAAAASQAQQSKTKQPHHQHHHHHHQYSYPRKSYYFTRELIPTNAKSTDTHFHDPPRRSSKQRLLKRRPLKSSSPKLVTSSVSAGCSCRATIWTKSSDSPPDYSASSSDSSTDQLDICDSFPPEFRSDRVLDTQSFDKMVAWSSSCGCNVDSNADDIIIDVEKKSVGANFDKLDLSDLDLPPILTKPAKFDDKVDDIKNKETKKTTKYRKSSAKYGEKNAHGSLSVKVVKEESVTMKEHKSSSMRRHSLNSPGLRLRVNSPKIANRKVQAHARKSVSSTSSSSSRRSLSDSLAIVKSSFDPQRDFRDSMVEMIVENNISASKDLEDLLACYLSLNSDEYHDLIINVFKQIWFDLTENRSK